MLDEADSKPELINNHVALEILRMLKLYYYFSIRSPKYRVYKRKENKRIAGFKGGTFFLSLVTILTSCKPGTLSDLHQGRSSRGNRTDSQQLLLTFSSLSPTPQSQEGVISTLMNSDLRQAMTTLLGHPSVYQSADTFPSRRSEVFPKRAFE